jgi:enamine deaminase RidA (YjgF/YER057c/UK114 family)
VTSPHRTVNPDGMPPPVGFAHAVVPAEGRLVFVAGQTAHQPDGSLSGTTVAEQFGAAARNVATVLAAAGARPDHVVNLTIYVTDVEEYLDQLGPIGEAYRGVFGSHYPAMALLGVARLFDAAARVELVATAVIPEAAT